MPETIDAIKIIIVFIIPGFVTDFIISFAVPRTKREPYEIILSAITFSCVNYALFSWLVFVIMDNVIYLKFKVIYISLWVFILLVAPILEGIIFVKFVNSNLSRKLFQFLKPKNIRFIPTAWDYIFSKEQQLWILITMKDDSRIGGLLRDKSFISAYPHEQDIYFEEVWHIGEHGEFNSPVESSSGCLIKMENVKHIEFFKVS